MKQKLYYLLALTFLLLIGTGKNVVHAAEYQWVHGGSSNTLEVTAAKGTGSANTYSNYSVSYGGNTYTTCVKMESATTLTFTTSKTATIIVVEALKNNNIYADDSKTKLNLKTTPTEGDEISVDGTAGLTESTTGSSSDGKGYEVKFSNVPAGTHVVKRAGSELGVFLIKVEELDASKAVKPTISFTEGATYHSASTVTISTSTPNATIYYTTNGDDPTTSSTQYTAPFAVNSACTVKAIAVAAGLGNSDVASQAVTIKSKHTITYDFSGVTLTQGSAPSNTTASDGSSYTLPKGRLYYIEGQTQTGWSDGTNTYGLGANVTINSNKTFTPVFGANSVALGDAAATVNWTFATEDGAPSAGLEGNIGYYAAQTTIGNTPLDVVMTINTTQNAGVEGSKGKWNTTSATNKAQVNKGTVFTIPAKKGMVVTYTATNGSPTVSDFSFAGENAGAVNDKTVTYTYNGTAETIDVIELTGNFYPSGISVAYPEEEKRTSSDLAITSATEVTLTANEPTSQITATTSATVTLTYSSSNNLIATVDANGLITAVANGTATITVSQTGDAAYQDDSKTVTVTVNNGVIPSYTVNAILNNETGTILTSGEIAIQGNAISLGINTANERVAADADDAVVAIAGNYYNDHGSTNLVITVKATGNMKFTIGNCTYNNGTATLKDAQDNTIKSVSLSGTGCWKGAHTDITTMFYEGEATTLTLSIPSYCPYIKVESVGDIDKYTVTFMNGNTQVEQKQIIQGENVGSLPTPQYDSNSKLFLGWYADTSDMGTKVLTSTVPTDNVTYNAIIADIPTATAGYYTPSNATELVAAVQYANQTSSANSPAKIFLKNGTYDLGSIAEIFQLTGSYVSIIGESLDGTVITNVPTQEGLGTATLLYNKGQYNYLQDLTLHNNYPYGDATGRAPSLKDEGNYTICNNVWLYSHQDTYYSHQDHSKFYFKGGKISGCVDYMCGQGRVYFDGVTLSNDNRGTTMTSNSELYVFNNCTIENGGSTYNFGRAWSSTKDFGDPVCVFLNTTLMDNGSNLASTRWNLTGINTDYAVAGEYGTKNASGTVITPANNNVTFTKKNTALNTILTAEQDAQYTMEYTLGNWATTATSNVVQATVSNVKLNGNTLSWTGTSDAYLIENDGEFVALTDETSYTVNGPGNYTVRAANGRGGFGEAVETTSGKVTISYTIGTNTTSFSCTPSTTDDVITFAETPYTLVANPMALDAKANLSVKLKCGTSSEAAATVSFNVPAGYAFVPYTAKAKVQPVTNSATVKLELKDANNTLSNDAASFKDGTITTSTLTAAETKYYTGTVTLGIYCYNNSDKGYRLSTPITISGELVEIISTNSFGNASHVAVKALDFSGVEGLKAYVATAADGAGITLAEVTAVPAGTAFVVQATEKAVQTYYIPTTTEDVTPPSQNVFEGSATEPTTTQSGYSYYALSKSKGMFAKVGSSVASIPAGKAFVKINNNVNAKETLMFFFDGETTGIVDAEAAEAKQNGVRKQFINGQLIIIKGDKQYNAAGGEF